MATPTESINQFESHHLLGYFETYRSVFFLKVGMLAFFESGNIEQHRQISDAASNIAKTMGDKHSSNTLASIGPEVATNFNEDAVTSLILAAWAVFEQVIKDVVTPDYATSTDLLQADFHRSAFDFTAREQQEIGLFYHLRNAIMHYNGAYHAYRTVDITYQNQHFQSDGNFGDKIIISPKLALCISEDLEKYAMQAWSKVAQPSGRK